MSFLLYDTSVLIKLKGLKVHRSVNTLLSRHKNYEALISEITYCEFLRGCKSRKDLMESKDIIADIPHLAVDSDLLRYTIAYYMVLTAHKDKKSRRVFNVKDIDHADIIIGTSAIVCGMLVCTTNRNHFPSPFFDEIDVENLSRTKEKIYMLKPNTSLFDRRCNSLMNALS